MRTFYFYLFLPVIIVPLYSQNKTDSLRFFHYFDIAYKLRNINPDSAFYWINKASEIAISTGEREWKAKAHNLKGILYYKKYNYYQSILELESAIKLTNNKDLKAKIYINLGNTLSDLNNSYLAKHYYEESVKLFNEIQNYQFLIRALINLSSEEFKLKLTTPARNHLKLALYYSKEYNLPEEEAICLNNLAAMFIKTRNIDSASRYIYQSFNVYEQLENYYGLVDAYLTAIELHLEKKELNYTKALIDIVDSIIDKLSYLEAKKSITGEKISYYLLSQNTEEALKYFNLYTQLEDSLNTKKLSGKSFNPSPSQKIYYENKSNNITVSLIQFISIILISIPLCIIIFKNYRHVKE